MTDLFEALLKEVEGVESKLNDTACALHELRARIMIELRSAEGRPDSRDARLARCLITQPWDAAVYTAISNEPPDPPYDPFVPALAEVRRHSDIAEEEHEAAARVDDHEVAVPRGMHAGHVDHVCQCEQLGHGKTQMASGAATVTALRTLVGSTEAPAPDFPRGVPVTVACGGCGGPVAAHECGLDGDGSEK